LGYGRQRPRVDECLLAGPEQTARTSRWSGVSAEATRCAPRPQLHTHERADVRDLEEGTTGSADAVRGCGQPVYRFPNRSAAAVSVVLTLRVRFRLRSEWTTLVLRHVDAAEEARHQF